jgi:hypothetical protein
MVFSNIMDEVRSIVQVNYDTATSVVALLVN